MWRGITAYVDAFHLINSKGLWRFLWIPFIISGILGALFLFLIFYVVPSLGDYLYSLWGMSTFPIWIQTIFKLFLILFVFFIYVFLFRYLLLIVSFPFMSLVSREVESLSYPHVFISSAGALGFLKELLRGVRISAILIWRELLFLLLLFLLTLIPGMALPVMPLMFIVQAYFAGSSNLDYTLERYYSVRDSLSFMQSNKHLAAGNGIVFLLLLCIPVVGLFIAPIWSTVAASIATLERLHGKPLPD
jgi:CysZ protein